MIQKTELISLNDKIPMRLYSYVMNEYKSHWHNGIEIIFVLSGEIDIIINDKLYNLKEDDIILVNKNHIHELRGMEPANLISLLIETDKLNIETEGLYFECNSTVDTNKGRYFVLKRLLAELVKVNSDKEKENDFYNLSFIYNILYTLIKHFKSEPGLEIESKKYVERLNDILKYIDNHYKENITFNQICDHLNLSVPYLSYFFKRYIGVNFQTYYNDLRLEKAVNELISSDNSVEQIAFNNGFANARSFVAVFKKKYDMLPSLYRKKNQTDSNPLSFAPVEELDKQSALNILAKYLVDRNIEKENEDTDISSEKRFIQQEKINVSKNGLKLKHTFRNFISVGRARELLYDEVREELIDLQKHCHFKNIKFHGLLSDEMFVYNEDDLGNPKYSFVYIDKVFDFLISINLKPLIQFSFMPKKLAKDPNRTCYATPFIISLPKDMNKWCELVKALTLHLIERYGKKEVESWLFTLWNEPDTGTTLFGFQNDEDFYQFYQETYKAVKAIDKKLQFGSPSLLLSYHLDQVWAKKFLEFTTAAKCEPDWLNIHYYENDFSDESIDAHAPALPSHRRLNQDENSFNKFITMIRHYFEELNFKDKPIYLTEWNLTVSHRDLLNDTCFKSCYIAKNILENYDRLDAFGYWTLTDMNEELIPVSDEFHGGLGLYTQNGIRKAHFYTFDFLSELGDTLIDKSDGYFITRKDNQIQMILYNYVHFNYLYAQGEIFDMTFTQRYTPFAEVGKMDISLELTNLPGITAEIREISLGQKSGSSFDEWVRMGAIKLSKTDIEYLKNISMPRLNVRRETINKDTLAINAALDPLEVKLIIINFEQ